MSTTAIYRYIFALVLSVLCLSAVPAFAQSDTAANAEESTPDRPKNIAGHQLAIGFDVAAPVRNYLTKNRYSYELEANYYLKNEFYAVAEGGWGGSEVNFTDLKYNTTNYFGRLGFNKSILYRESPHDWDMMFIGIRAALSNVNRGAATYTIIDSVWGNQAGISSGKSFVAGWLEITTGMRVELIKGVLAGWNLRGKFLMNGKSFKDLAPLNIAGYGKGDKNANFDFNLYICYAIRWNRTHPSIPDDTQKDTK
jgi:hypothetical protein